MTTGMLFFTIGLIAFVLAFPIPFFARRFGKFLPADAGTALVRSFHIPRLAKSSSPALKKRRRQLWLKLFRGGFLWGIMGIIAIFALICFDYSTSLFLMLWICGLLACIDEKLHVLPDVLTVPLLILGFFFATVSTSTIMPAASAAGALFGFLLPTVTAAIMTPFYPRSLGGGDFKMLAALGAWLGFSGLAVAVLISVLFFAVIALIRHQKEGPYGTSLLLGTVTVLILQQIAFFDFLFVLV